MGCCNCCLPRPKQRTENALLREEGRGNRRTRYGEDTGGRIVIDAGFLADEKTSTIEETWASDIRDCFVQKASLLAIHTDLPRLVRKMTIINASGDNVTPALDADPLVPMKENQVLPPTIGNDERMRKDEIVVLNFLLTLAKTVNDQFTYNYIVTNFWNFFPRQEMSGPLRTLLIDIESKCGEEVPVTIKLLKMANQRVMFPAFWCLKSKLNLNTMRDKRGTWHISFILHEDRVEVIHSKTQLVDNREVAMKEEGEFEIALVLALAPANTCENLTEIYMEIRNVVLEADITPEDRDAWQALFDKHHMIR